MTKSGNVLAKAEIAHHEQFLLLPHVFKLFSASEASESVYMRERVNSSPHTINLQQTTLKTYHY